MQYKKSDVQKSPAGIFFDKLFPDPEHQPERRDNNDGDNRCHCENQGK